MGLAARLRSHSTDERNLTRRTLVKIASSLGPRHFATIVRELARHLTRGYQRHILSYTVHALLQATIPPLVAAWERLSRCELLGGAADAEGKETVPTEKREADLPDEGDDAGGNAAMDIEPDTGEQPAGHAAELAQPAEHEGSSSGTSSDMAVPPPGVLDECVPDLVAIFLDDLFGDVAEEKEVREPRPRPRPRPPPLAFLSPFMFTGVSELSLSGELRLSERTAANNDAASLARTL